MLFGLVFYNVYGLVCSEHIEGMNKLKLKCIKCALNVLFITENNRHRQIIPTCQLAEESFFSLCFIYTNITFRSSYNKPKDF